MRQYKRCGGCGRRVQQALYDDFDYHCMRCCEITTAVLARSGREQRALNAEGTCYLDSMEKVK